MAAFVPNDERDDYFFNKDAIAQSKSFWIQVVISFSRRVICGLIVWPDNICESWSRYTVLCIALIVEAWRTGPEIAVIRLGGTTDVSWCTTP